jgi:hypothetical protein
VSWLSDALDGAFDNRNDHGPEAVVASLTDGGAHEDPTTAGLLSAGRAGRERAGQVVTGFPDGRSRWCCRSLLRQRIESRQRGSCLNRGVPVRHTNALSENTTRVGRDHASRRQMSTWQPPANASARCLLAQERTPARRPKRRPHPLHRREGRHAKDRPRRRRHLGLQRRPNDARATSRDRRAGGVPGGQEEGLCAKPRITGRR